MVKKSELSKLAATELRERDSIANWAQLLVKQKLANSPTEGAKCIATALIWDWEEGQQALALGMTTDGDSDHHRDVITRFVGSGMGIERLSFYAIRRDRFASLLTRYLDSLKSPSHAERGRQGGQHKKFSADLQAFINSFVKYQGGHSTPGKLYDWLKEQGANSHTPYIFEELEIYLDGDVLVVAHADRDRAWKKRSLEPYFKKALTPA